MKIILYTILGIIIMAFLLAILAIAVGTMPIWILPMTTYLCFDRYYEYKEGKKKKEEKPKGFIELITDGIRNIKTDK